jgi:hypothetical protein
VRKHHDGNANHELSDDELVDREQSERREYMRLEQRETHLRDTNYQKLNASKALLHAWERWWKTTVAARGRGLAAKLFGS